MKTAIKKIREDGYKKTIIVGGPHPTTSFNEVMDDRNIDICVIGEGEITLEEIVRKLIQNNGVKLSDNDLNDIDGIAYNESDNFVVLYISKKKHSCLYKMILLFTNNFKVYF